MASVACSNHLCILAAELACKSSLPKSNIPAQRLEFLSMWRTASICAGNEHSHLFPPLLSYICALKSHRLIRLICLILATANWILVVLSARTLFRHLLHVSSPSLFQVELRKATSWIETTLDVVSDACHGMCFRFILAYPC